MQMVQRALLEFAGGALRCCAVALMTASSTALHKNCITLAVARGFRMQNSAHTKTAILASSASSADERVTLRTVPVSPIERSPHRAMLPGTETSAAWCAFENIEVERPSVHCQYVTRLMVTLS